MAWFDVLKVAAPNLQQRANIAETPQHLQGLRQRSIQFQNTPLPEKPQVEKPQEQSEYHVGDVDVSDASDVNEAERRLAAHKPLLDKPGHGRHRALLANAAVKLLEARVEPTNARRLTEQAEDMIETIV